MRAGMVTLTLSLLAVVPVRDADHPNIVFIMSDDHAAHAIGAYGSRVNQTPHLDRLAREGMLDLHAQPRRDPHRSVLARQWRDDVQPVRQLAHDGGSTCSGGRLL